MARAYKGLHQGKRKGSGIINKHLSVLLACLFVVMIGLGITMPVLPFYVERLALAEHVSRQSIDMHVGLLTGLYALGQLIFAPVWGACQTERAGDRSFDRHCWLRRRADSFGLATSLWLRYAARILGVILSSVTLPVSAAYIADMTLDE